MLRGINDEKILLYECFVQFQNASNVKVVKFIIYSLFFIKFVWLDYPVKNRGRFEVGRD